MKISCKCLQDKIMPNLVFCCFILFVYFFLLLEYLLFLMASAIKDFLNFIKNLITFQASPVEYYAIFNQFFKFILRNILRRFPYLPFSEGQSFCLALNLIYKVMPLIFIGLYSIPSLYIPTEYYQDILLTSDFSSGV